MVLLELCAIVCGGQLDVGLFIDIKIDLVNLGAWDHPVVVGDTEPVVVSETIEYFVRVRAKYLAKIIVCYLIDFLQKSAFLDRFM